MRKVVLTPQLLNRIRADHRFRAALDARTDIDREWRERGACVRAPEPDVFFPQVAEDLEPARRVCSVCPVAGACLVEALERAEIDGIWGGTSTAERRTHARSVAARHRRSRLTGPFTGPSQMVRTLDVGTDHGTARLFLHPAAPGAAGAHRPGLVMLLHGAGSGAGAAPLPEFAALLATAGVAVARLDQPYRVAGRRAPAPARQLDAVLATVLAALPDLHGPAAQPLVLAGRSSGARVACRWAAGGHSPRPLALLALGFPLQPPARRDGLLPPDRLQELQAAAAQCPVLVVQGSRDRFGMPSAGPGVQVRIVAGMGHTPTPAAAAVAVPWILDHLDQATAGTPARGRGVVGTVPDDVVGS